ncbi:hemolysin family protein [uncultured Bilophila sp.]|uniref:hemolysin family protein n=1 Tax=uncultured Bilophila sp. TaxID=529385 RepID=UPI00260DF3A6|nr:hemolysin family protein [uncultured Bilophila sp.]
MIALLLTVFLVVLISATCSMTEAALYSVPWTYIEQLRKKGSATGELLYQLRSRIDQPIAAVLTLNTVANTAGAAIAGALAANVLGADNTALFAAGLTFLILAFGEILPKTLGVAHACGIAGGMARPLRLMVLIFKPFIWFSSMLTRLVAPPQSGPTATEDDIRAITSLSRETGRIQAYEENAIKNILSLDVKHVREIMTPRMMVFSLQEEMTVREAYDHPHIWHYSRIPLYGDDNEDIVGIVLRKDLGRYVSNGETDKKLLDIMQPVHFVLESLTVDKLLLEFLESRLHLFVVLDEYGGLAGVVSLEDVLEEMLGREIVDETDAVADLREAARQRRSALTQARTQQAAALREAREEAAKAKG